MMTFSLLLCARLLYAMISICNYNFSSFISKGQLFCELFYSTAYCLTVFEASWSPMGGKSVIRQPANSNLSRDHCPKHVDYCMGPFLIIKISSKQIELNL